MAWHIWHNTATDEHGLSDEVWLILLCKGVEIIHPRGVLTFSAIRHQPRTSGGPEVQKFGIEVSRVWYWSESGVSISTCPLATAMAIYSSSSMETPLLLSAFTKASPQVIYRKPIAVAKCILNPSASTELGKSMNKQKGRNPRLFWLKYWTSIHHAHLITRPKFMH